jgi:hypothetical protein
MAEVEQRTMRMYLQSMPKSGFACVFVTFIVAFTATLLVGGLAGASSMPIQRANVSLNDLI